MLPLWKAYDGHSGWTVSIFVSGAVSLFNQQRPAWKETQGCLFSNTATWPSRKRCKSAEVAQNGLSCLKSHGFEGKCAQTESRTARASDLTSPAVKASPNVLEDVLDSLLDFV